MKYLFRDRLASSALLATYHKQNHVVHPDHHDYHPHFELYVRRTPLAQEITLNGSSLRVDTPCAVLTAPFSIHTMSTVDEDSAEFERFVIYFDQRFLDSFGESVLPHKLFFSYTDCLFPLTVPEAKALSPLLDMLFDSTLPEGERAALLALLLSRLARLVPEERRVGFAKLHDYIPQVLQYLYRHADEPLYAEEIAARFHVSRAKLNRDFGASVGQSLHQAIIDLRITNAKRLLAENRLSLREIALRCGFSSELYFHTAFKRVTGVAPSVWRRAQA